MNRFRFYLLALLIAVASAPAKAQHCAMVQTLHYGSGIFDIRTATDPAGNTYYAGNFQGVLEVAGTQAAPPAGDNSVNLYVAKFDAGGNLLWLKNGGSLADDILYAIALDGVGGVYVSGTGGRQFQFGSTPLDSAGTHLFKLDATTGATRWIRIVGTNAPLTPNYYRGISVRALTATSTDLYFGGTADLNSALDGIPLQTTPFGQTGLVARCSPTDGTVTAVWQCVPTVDSVVIDVPFVTLDPNGEVLISGGYNRTVQFGTAAGAQTQTAQLLSPLSTLEHFIVRLTPSATGGTTHSVMDRLPWVSAMTMDQHGDCYVAGYTPRAAIGTIAMPDSGVYVARISRQGTVRWAAGNHSKGAICNNLITDPSGRVYGAGQFIEPTFPFGTYTVPNTPDRHLTGFFFGVDSAGTVLWARGADNPGGNTFFSQGLGIDANNRLYASGISMSGVAGYAVQYDGLTIRPRSAYLLRFDPAAEVNGHAYLDANGNGVRDLGEAAFPRPVVVQEVTTPTPSNYTTDAGGLYHALLPPGAYELRAVAPTYYTVSGPQPNSYSGTLSALGQVVTGRDFGLAPLPHRTDVRVTLTPYSICRRGFVNRYRVRVENLGTDTVASGQVVVQFDPATPYVGAFPTPVHYTTNSATWNFQHLRPFATADFDVACTIPLNVALGTLVHQHATVTLPGGDLNPANDVDSLSQTVSGSFDPNDLTVNYANLTPAQIAAGTPLEYAIQFQNIGSDTAFTVLVQDTLPAQLLRLGTLELLSASHNCWWNLLGNNQLLVRFDGINLPSQNTDALGSMGFVRFQVKPGAALAPGISIPNKAHIAFDYNAPVATNGVTTLVQAPNGLVAEAGVTDWHLYPNPAAATATVILTGEVASGPVTVRLLDALGREVRQLTLHVTAGEMRQPLALHGVAAGLYLVELQVPGRAPARQRLVVQDGH